MMLYSGPFLLAILVGEGIVYILSVAIYRTIFHPLAQYPGPFLAKLTSWYDVYHAYKGDKHLLLHHLHQKYGTFVRYGPNALSVNDPAALKTIYGHKANVRKSPFYLAFAAAPGIFSTHTAIDRYVHARKRRVMSHAFSDAALKSLEELTIVHVRDFVKKLTTEDSPAHTPSMDTEQGWTAPKDISSWCSYLGFDVMGDLCFGKSFGMLGDNSENREAISLLCQAAKRHNVTGPMPWLHQSKVDRLLFRKLYTDREKYLAFSRKQVMERTKHNVDPIRKDIFHHLLHAKDPETGEGFSERELWGESNTLIIAGSDTTSTTLTTTIFYLLHDAQVLERAKTEIRSTFASAEDIRSGPTLNGCSYLRSCIDEALRMSPPVGAILPRTVLPGGLHVLGHSIPHGTSVGCPIYALHHHEGFIPDPFTYNPSRWIIGEPYVTTATLEALHSVFNPFSIGPRGCIGKPMAYMELMLTLTRLLWGYDMKLAPGDLGRVGEGAPGNGAGRERRHEFQMEDIFVSRRNGPFALFKSK